MFEEKVNRIIQKAFTDGDTAGANLLLLKNGKEIYYTQCGYANMEYKRPFNRDTIIRLYSQTKPVTAAAVMMLVASGDLDLGDPLYRYLPEYQEMYVIKDGKREHCMHPMTVHNLMSMSSGLPYPDPATPGGRYAGEVFEKIADRLYSNHPVTTMEFARLMSGTDLCFEPGERFMYGTSADVLGALVEKISGMSFRDFLIKNLFEPLEMYDTDFYVPEEKRDRLAEVYQYSEQGMILTPTDHLGLRYQRDMIPAFQSGGAGLCSTLDDYSHFAAMLLNHGCYKSRQIMPRRAVEYMTGQGGLLSLEKCSFLADDWRWATGYAYGNMMSVLADPNCASIFAGAGEYGWGGWLGSYFSNDPSCGLTMLLGIQVLDIGQAGSLARRIKNVVMCELE